MSTPHSEAPRDPDRGTRHHARCVEGVVLCTCAPHCACIPTQSVAMAPTPYTQKQHLQNQSIKATTASIPLSQRPPFDQPSSPELKTLHMESLASLRTQVWKSFTPPAHLQQCSKLPETLQPLPRKTRCPPPPTPRVPNHHMEYIEPVFPHQPRPLAPRTCWVHLSHGPRISKCFTFGAGNFVAGLRWAMEKPFLPWEEIFTEKKESVRAQGGV